MTDRYTVTEIEEDKHIAVILERQRERERAREREREREMKTYAARATNC